MTTFLAHFLLGFDLLCSCTAWDQTHVALLRHFRRNTFVLTLSSRLRFGSLCNIPLRRYTLTTAFNDSGSRRAHCFSGGCNVGKTVRVF
jgi:hypothetical protein